MVQSEIKLLTTPSYKLLPEPVYGRNGTLVPTATRLNLPENTQISLNAYESVGWQKLPGYEGGRTFQNRRGDLPDYGSNYYKEWDVNPQQQGVNRGTERFVTGKNGEVYHTDTHYGDTGNPAFRRIK